ncbi:MAG: response regulator [Pegethrix bostrychoides GSE-TBD4-15B]|jgi:PAS domain S-box-containing protein|uniref:Circadian input-output histidine kinase CikA n=1 Tax=Pegethrix bostrychoides GSE-TBD4-15B TaxID=2839662 RepID=A0A951U5W1_9CYAN|nr:response regulator [Pegethrix bostrychoides GSE-TBD4-15B]
MSQCKSRLRQVSGEAIGIDQWRFCSIALLYVALALGITLLLLPWLHPTTTPFFFVAVMISAWYGGWQAGLLATVLSTLAITYFFVEPFYSLQVLNLQTVVQLSTFSAAAGLISALNQSRRTALKQARENLQALRDARSGEQKSEERYQTLIESIDEAFCIIEMLFDQNNTPIDYRFLEINPAFEQQTGLQQAVGKTARQLVPDLDTFWFETYGRVALTGEPVRLENHSVPMNRWFDVYACRTDEPEARKVAIVFRDISDRKAAEDFLRRAADLSAFRVSLADSLRLLADPIAVQATASRLLGEYLGANRVAYFEVRGADYVVERDYVNGAIALVGQYSIDSFGQELLATYRTGRSVCLSDVTTDPNLSVEQQAAYAAVQIGAYIGIPLIRQGEFVAGLAVHAATPRVWTADEVTLAQEVAERIWITIQRTQAEAALLQSEELTRLAAAAANLGIWFWQVQTHELKWTDQCKALFGLPADAEVSYETALNLIHPDDRQRVNDAAMKALQERVEYNVEYRAIWADGSIHWIAAKGRGSYDEQGNPIRMMGTVQNISDRVQIERDRERILQEEQAAREAAESANRVKDEFLAVVSHELRAPLNPILGWSQLLQQGKLDAARTKSALMIIVRNAQLQAQLIDDLLDIARILRGKLSLNEAAVDLGAVISSALETLRLAAEAKALHIEVNLPTQVKTVMGDAGRLQQVVWNLLSNAVKFTPQGGRITVASTQAASYAQIQVSDTGKGIHPDFLPYVFEHFRQEDGATTRKFGGLGLGLAIARQIVEMHGGQISVESRGEGQGATFTVQLPLAPTSSQLPPSERSSISIDSDLNGIQIFVVDDEPDSREFIAFALEQAGAIVTHFASGIEALQAVEHSTPDLIVSDIGMPEMDGYMLMQQIRTLEASKHLPAIALTAYAGEFDRQQALKAGFQRHIAKPVEPTALVTAIAAAISVAK